MTARGPAIHPTVLQARPCAWDHHPLPSLPKKQCQHLRVVEAWHEKRSHRGLHMPISLPRRTTLCLSRFPLLNTQASSSQAAGAGRGTPRLPASPRRGSLGLCFDERERRPRHNTNALVPRQIGHGTSLDFRYSPLSSVKFRYSPLNAQRSPCAGGRDASFACSALVRTCCWESAHAQKSVPGRPHVYANSREVCTRGVSRSIKCACAQKCPGKSTRAHKPTRSAHVRRPAQPRPVPRVLSLCCAELCDG